ncbi:potassium channel, voltage gated subfamily E regulatory beta subunit 5 L homeolog isoform X1 [Xenopus laevis]|uniref:Potassium channel, voltage gated subfamily E regulatory beta subunit 5 L homeolog n=2 Tax=Xenopus laevis TaxID=8355 RepID=Q8AWZ7_XENLA|nr:potassium channel, voltage gated subfamily E regulatory beta subunit 5 L homeolog [Xenopus laevis]XP_018084215.1 potassium channel, voltage gated subfamily E regulatory beta subunit 5 L homeolog isoform X1 [Xenopus laevis]AAN77246.1 voltage-gated potassium channel subunit MiRP4.1 [Xenopus laevis]OCT67497.1 hypothetical protein XELAEV_18038795mg [Xenopus laevis]
MNCSNTSRLRSLLTQLLQELGKTNSTVPPMEEDDNDDAYLYILLIMIFYGCLAGGLILAYTRSRKQESKNDPYHLYIEREWNKNKNTPNIVVYEQRGSIESENLL